MSGHARARAGWFVGAAAGAALAIAPPGALPPPLAAVLLALVFAIVPGVWLARSLAPGEPGDVRGALALLLAPFASGALMALPRIAGFAAAPVARGMAAVLAILCVREELRPRDGEPESERGAWAVAVAVGGLLLLAHALSRPLAARSDGSFHAGVVWAAVRAVPPEDPFFAGLALRYFWGLHVWSAAWVALAPGLGAYVPLITSAALAAVSALLAVGALARRLGASAGAQRGAQALALLGGTPFAWLVLVARAFKGEVRGRAELARALSHGADTALRSLDPGLLHPSLVLPLDKFVVLTPFAWGLAGCVVAALVLARALETRGWRPAAALALVVAALLFVHPVAGAAVAAAAFAGLFAAAFVSSGARAALGRVFLALLCGALMMLPYLHAVSGGEGAEGLQLELGMDPRGVWSALLAGALVLPWAGWDLVRGGGSRTDRVALGGMLAVLVAAACVLRFHGDNQSKLLNLAFFLAAAPAALAWAHAAAEPQRGPVLRAFLGAALAPTLAAVLWAYATESGASLDAPSLPPRALLPWVRELVPSGAWLVDATADTTRGAAPGLPGETGRALLWSGGFMARKWGYDAGALELRDASARSLARGRWPVLPRGELVRAHGRETWVITWADSARNADRRWRVEARAEGVVLARIVGR